MSTSDKSTEAESTAPRRAGLNRWPVFDIEYVIESSDDEHDQCTLYPREAGEGEDEALGSWIAADEGSYVSLAEVR